MHANHHKPQRPPRLTNDAQSPCADTGDDEDMGEDVGEDEDTGEDEDAGDDGDAGDDELR